MLRPRRDRLDGFSGKGEEYYADWLRRSLHAYRFGGRGLPPGDRRAFRHVEPYMGLTGYPADDLADVVHVMDHEDRLDIANACGIAFAGLDLDDARDATVAEDLIRLAANLRARSVLLAFAGMPVRDLALPGAERLYLESLRLFASLPDALGERVAEALAHLVRQRDPFPPAWADTALKALARAAPERLAAHLDLLRGPLAARFDRAEDPAEEARRAPARNALLREVARLVPADATLRAAVFADRRGPDDAWKAEGADWMRAALWDHADRTLDAVRARVDPAPILVAAARDAATVRREPAGVVPLSGQADVLAWVMALERHPALGGVGAVPAWAPPA